MVLREDQLPANIERIGRELQSRSNCMTSADRARAAQYTLPAHVWALAHALQSSSNLAAGLAVAPPAWKYPTTLDTARCSVICMIAANGSLGGWFRSRSLAAGCAHQSSPRFPPASHAVARFQQLRRVRGRGPHVASTAVGSLRPPRCQPRRSTPQTPLVF